MRDKISEIIFSELENTIAHLEDQMTKAEKELVGLKLIYDEARKAYQADRSYDPSFFVNFSKAETRYKTEKMSLEALKTRRLDLLIQFESLRLLESIRDLLRQAVPGASETIRLKLKNAADLN